MRLPVVFVLCLLVANSDATVHVLSGGKKVEYVAKLDPSLNPHVTIYDHELLGEYNETTTTSEARCRHLQISMFSMISSFSRNADGSVVCRGTDNPLQTYFGYKVGSTIFYELREPYERLVLPGGTFYVNPESGLKTFEQLKTTCGVSTLTGIPMPRSDEAMETLSEIAKATSEQRVFVGAHFRKDYGICQGFKWLDGKNFPFFEIEVNRFSSGTSGVVSITNNASFQMEYFQTMLLPVCAFHPFG